MKYRSEIDGLRSLAILPVVAYHAGASAMPGGFTGVDIFFVISGFLITTIIRDELERGAFSILEFYKRRVLRIVPALMAVLTATMVMAYFVMLPSQLTDLGGSVIAAALFFSNIWFWKANDGYFIADSEFFPLLHTWSLAVEEQFYLFFPLLMIVIARYFFSRYAAVILTLCIGSFLLCLWGTANEPSATFYLLPTRAWELGVGALLAVITIPEGLKRRIGEGASLFGVALLALGIFTVTADMPFPGTNALYPVIGAALIIAFSQGTSVGRLLSTGPLVWIGRISYSLYLWHWPVIVFYRLEYDAQPGRWGMMEMILISFALATLSYYFIEQPFRTRKMRYAPTPRILTGGVAALGMAGVVGLAALTTGNTWRTYPDDVARIASFLDYGEREDYERQFRPGTCMIGSGDEGFAAFEPETCLALDDKRPNYLVFGDSHSGHIWRAIADEFPDVNVLQASASGCRPTLDAEGKQRCLDLLDYIFNDFVPSAGLDGVILAARWEESDLEKIAATVKHLENYAENVVVLGPTVEYQGELPVLLAKSLLSGNDDLLVAARDSTRKTLSDHMAERLQGTGAQYMPVYDYICNDWSCLAETPGGEPMQFDYGHFTMSGSIEIVRLMKADPQNPLRLQ